MKYKNLHLIYGPMYSGKSKLLIETYYKKLQNKKIFKPKIDTKNRMYVRSRDGLEVKAISLEYIEEVYQHLENEGVKFIFFDETFMFKGDIERTIRDLLEKKYEIYLSTLDMDFRGIFFKNVELLFECAYKYNLHPLTARCFVCNRPSRWSVRIVDGKIANENSPTILIDKKIANIHYETRCDKHRNFTMIKEQPSEKNIYQLEKTYNYEDKEESLYELDK